MFSHTSDKGAKCPAFLLKSIELVHLDYHSSWQDEETVAVLIATKLLPGNGSTRAEGLRRVTVKYYEHELQFLLVRGDGQRAFPRVGTWCPTVSVKEHGQFQVQVELEKLLISKESSCEAVLERITLRLL
jgi:hypothetical protein